MMHCDKQETHAASPKGRLPGRISQNTTYFSRLHLACLTRLVRLVSSTKQKLFAKTSLPVASKKQGFIPPNLVFRYSKQGLLSALGDDLGVHDVLLVSPPKNSATQRFLSKRKPFWHPLRNLDTIKAHHKHLLRIQKDNVWRDILQKPTKRPP